MQKAMRENKPLEAKVRAQEEELAVLKEMIVKERRKVNLELT